MTRLLLALCLAGVVALAPPLAGLGRAAEGTAVRDAGKPTDAPWRRGKYLVESILACGNCHSPRGLDNSVIAGRELSGGRPYDTPAFYVTPGNLTSDPETGLGTWMAEDLKRALTTGVRPNGVPLAPMMPVAFVKAMTDEDLDAVVSYVRALPPIRNAMPPPIYRREVHSDAYPDAQRAFTERAMAADQAERGRYLGALGHCLDCHTPVVDGVTDYDRDGGRGGKRVGLARVLAPNITSHPAAGLGGWSDAEIRRALTTGTARDGHQLQYPMPWPFLALLDDADLGALIAWLRSLPPKE